MCPASSRSSWTAPRTARTATAVLLADVHPGSLYNQPSQPAPSRDATPACRDARAPAEAPWCRRQRHGRRRWSATARPTTFPRELLMTLDPLGFRMHESLLLRHSLLGCLFFGAFSAKMPLLRSGRLPGRLFRTFGVTT
ncbi:DUF6529 family protein [Streptomyces sp. NPDC002787]